TEALLFERYAEGGPGRHVVDGGPWSGRVAHVGPRLPAGQGGELWLDTCELALMILLPRDERQLAELSPKLRERITPFGAWMALRPVTRWQFAAFHRLARREFVAQPHRERLSPFDPARLLGGPETDSITRLSCDEAGLYSWWFGKGMTSQEE